MSIPSIPTLQLPCFVRGGGDKYILSHNLTVDPLQAFKIIQKGPYQEHFEYYFLKHA